MRTAASRDAKTWIRAQADEAFDRANRLDIEPKCAGKPEIYVDFKPSERPSAEGAVRLCSGCPLLQACRDKAHNLPVGEAHGVYGGQVWVDGRLQAE